ncbi:N-6 DNA methylase [Streptomyces sp. NPDC056465]|uniref:N-6 DNA methylase n=1 Tax=Streptomyces sp. NPDC056465 TaxID=3345829 RepID=UPI0036B0E7A7
MRLLDLLGDGEDKPAVPDTFRRTPAPTPAPAPSPDEDGAPLLPGTRRTVPRERPYFAATPAPPAPPTPARRHRYARRSGMTIGERVCAAWNNAHGGSRLEIPVGTVAALALLPFEGPEVLKMADWLMGLSDTDLWKLYEETWAHHWIDRPDLIDRASILATWLQDDKPDTNTLRGVRAVTKAALTNGMMDYTHSGIPSMRTDIDLMSWVITRLRSEGARQGLGEYHTPPEVCDVMARLTCDLSAMKPGQAFYDPAAGTGGMVRSLANYMRDGGLNPHDFTWHLTDVDPLAAAGAAVNVLLWDLGPNAYVSCGDSLADPELPRKAMKHAAGARARRNDMVATARMLAAIGKAERLMARAVEEAA